MKNYKMIQISLIVYLNRYFDILKNRYTKNVFFNNLQTVMKNYALLYTAFFYTRIP